MSHTTLTRLAHQRLDAYHAALELFEGVERVAATLPRGHAELKDQLRRAAGATENQPAPHGPPRSPPGLTQSGPPLGHPA